MNDEIKNVPNRRPVAYKNETFLNSPDARILRILSEYIEPLTHFRRENIRDTVVAVWPMIGKRPDAAVPEGSLPEPSQTIKGLPPMMSKSRFVSELLLMIR